MNISTLPSDDANLTGAPAEVRRHGLSPFSVAFDGALLPPGFVTV
jgi:hypothetical protein